MTIERAQESASTTLDQGTWTQIDSMTITADAGDFLALFSMDVQFDSSPGSEILQVAIFVNNVIQDHSVRKIQANSSLPSMYCPIVTSALVSPGASQVVDVRYQISGNSMVGTKRELNLLPENTTSFQDTDTVSDSIASGTWTTLDTMTRTPPAGNYLLVFTAYADTPNDEEVGFRLSVGGSPVAHTERWLTCETSANPALYPVMIAASIAPNGSQVVEIEWARITGSGTQNCYERNMILIEVDSGDIFQATGTVTDSDSTTTDKQMDDMLISDPGAGDYLAIFSSHQYYDSLSAPGAGTIYSIYNGGVQEADTQRNHFHEDSLDTTWRPVFTTGKITVDSGTDDIQGYWQGSATDTRDLYERTMVIVLDPFPPPPWTGPIVADTNTSTGTGTTPSVSLPPNIDADDLLFIVIATDGDNTVTNWNGFTQLGTESYGTVNSFHVGWKKATGSEGSSVTITLSVNEPSSHISYRITGHEDPATQAPEISTVVEGSSATPDPGSLDPTGAAKKFLWIHACGWDRDRTVSAWNAEFIDNRLSSIYSGSGGCGCALSTVEDEVATKDPGTITISTGDTWIAWTIAIHPVGVTVYKDTISGSARILGTIKDTISGLARIKEVSIKDTISGVARIIGQVKDTISGGARILGEIKDTISGSARIKGLDIKDTISGLARILETNIKDTISGNARILEVIKDTASGFARIKEVSIKDTISGNATINIVVKDTISGLARILGVVKNTISGTARILETDIKDTISGLARILGVDIKDTISGLARIKELNIKDTISGNATINIVVKDTISGVARIKGTIKDTISGFANITTIGTIKTTKSGIARILGVIKDTISGSARILETDIKDTISGAARIMDVLKDTASGLARIKGLNIKDTISGNARVLEVNIKDTISGGARILGVIKDTISGSATINIVVKDVISGLARIKGLDIKDTIGGLARIKGLSIKNTISGLARVKEISLKDTISGVARILGQVKDTISGYANIQAIGEIKNTISGIARILGVIKSTISGEARVLEVIKDTIGGLARIKEEVKNTISGLSRVKGLNIKDIMNGVARIKGLGLKNIISGVSRIEEVNKDTISGTARILAIIKSTISGQSRVKGVIKGVISGAARITLYNRIKGTINGYARIVISIRATFDYSGAEIDGTFEGTSINVDAAIEMNEPL